MMNNQLHLAKSLRQAARYSIRLGFGLLLCANYSCSSTNSVTGNDPFSRGPQGPVPGSSPIATAGNHRLLEQSSVPLAQSQSAQKNVGHEWPAIPEQRVGVALPQRANGNFSGGSLPPGGYHQPIGGQHQWTEPMARIVSPSTPLTKKQPAGPSSTQITQVGYEQQGTANLVGKKQSAPQESQQNEIVQTAFAEPAFGSTLKDAPPLKGESTFTPSDPRLPITQVSGSAQVSLPPSPPLAPCLPGVAGPAACSSCDPAFYPDEYLCDGGDRKLPVHYSPGFRQGLDTQDTIAEYQDEQGKQHVKKSNQACVYAPRFAAVTTTAGVSENLSINRALGAYETVNGMAMNTRIKPNTEKQTDQLKAARVRSRVSGLESEEITLGMNQATKLEKHSKLVNTNTDYAFSGHEQFDQKQTPVAMNGIKAAAQWTRRQSPVIIASDVAGAEVYSSFRPDEMVGLEEKMKSPGKIFITKSADKADAKPGDVITFTIRYKNTGDRSLNNVVIVDNLTPRLEYIETTGTSDRDGRLVVEDNEEGSLILKWEIDEELKGHTGGTVSFKAKVR